MASVKKLLKLWGLLFLSPAVAAPWNGGIEVGTSVAHSYGSRSLFTNPAALAFEKELNGSGLLSSFTYGSTFNHQSEFSISNSYNFFGFGYEKLYQGTDSYSRYQLGVSYLLSQDLFWGTKFSTTSSDTPSLSKDFSWDLGVQYRPLPFLSMGLIVSELNQSTINGIKSPTVYTLGTAFRPLDWLTITADIETPSNDFIKTLSYQTTLAVEPFQGLTLSSGYQKDHRFQTGIQFDLAKTSLFSVLHPSPKDSVKENTANYTLGFQTSIKPSQSVLNTPKELKITLDDSLSEEGRESTFLTKAKPSLTEVLESIKSAGENSLIEKITIQIDEFSLGLAAAEEITEALLKARDQGKQIDVFLVSAKTKEYLIASAATTIHLEPSGDITLLGPRVAHYFAKGILDKIGVEGEFIARGDYKSAPETFTRKESSIKNREATQHELKQIEEALLQILQRTRKITKTQWQTWLKYAVFSSQDALKETLIDKVESYSKVKNSEFQKSSIGAATSFASKSLNLPNRIAVITAEGNILEKRIRFFSLTGQSQITPKSLEPLFKKAINDPRTKAIVLRVSSPGGEVLASEQIANLVSEAQSKKPVIISMGDVAASGGYFISAPAQMIFANKLTLTGSIGVFLGKFNLGRLYQKLDLHKEVTGLGPYPGIDSEHKAWIPEERVIMQRRLNQYYESFVEFVAKQRKISKGIAEKAAQGRVWLGEESIGLKIIDKNGGILEAIESAKKHTGLSTPFVIYPVRESLGIFEAISEETVPSISSQLNSFGFLINSDLQKEAAKLSWIQKHPFLYLAPGF